MLSLKADCSYLLFCNLCWASPYLPAIRCFSSPLAISFALFCISQVCFIKATSSAFLFVRTFKGTPHLDPPISYICPGVIRFARLGIKDLPRLCYRGWLVHLNL